MTPWWLSYWFPDEDGQLVLAAIAAGYAYAAGHVDAPAPGSQLNPAALIAASRAGWTMAEAVAVAAPMLNSSLRMIGDPLGRLMLPRQGYNIYRRATSGGDDELVAVAPAGVTAVDVVFAEDSSQFIQVRAVSRLGVEDVESVRLVRVDFDGDALRTPAPNAPLALQLTPAAGGAMAASWSYRPNGQAAEPAVFNIYVATGESAFDFDSADHQVSFASRSRFEQDLGTFANGTKVRVIVRAATAEGAEERNARAVTAFADAQAPEAPIDVAAEVDAE